MKLCSTAATSVYDLLHGFITNQPAALQANPCVLSAQQQWQRAFTPEHWQHHQLQPVTPRQQQQQQQQPGRCSQLCSLLVDADTNAAQLT
jgi:hypothetical protein